MNKTYQIMQEAILKKLDEGTIPWRKTWSSGGSPKNIVSGKDYRGFNHLYLSCLGQPSEYWLTFNQAKKLGGYVKLKEKGSKIIYYNFKKKIDKETGKEKTYPIMKQHTVFNLSQCENVEAPSNEDTVYDNTPIEECEAIINGYETCPPIKNHHSPIYNFIDDFIGIPDINKFESTEEYYASLWHEAIHSTKFKTRLGRDIDKAREELIAEIGASFLCSKCRIDSKVIDNTAAYIDGWRKRISSDPKLIIQCASMAQKACDYILNITNDQKEN